MNKVIIDKGSIPSPEEEEDDPNDMPPLVLIEYDEDIRHSRGKNRARQGSTQADWHQRLSG